MLTSHFGQDPGVDLYGIASRFAADMFYAKLFLNDPSNDLNLFVVPWCHASLHVILKLKNIDNVLLHIMKGFVSGYSPLPY